MSCVRFKLKSSLEYDKVTFDGLHISVGDLRKKIMAQKKLGITDNFTLQIMDAQSKKVYSNDSETVPRNTSVIIMRVPVANSQKNPKIQSRDISIPKDNGVVFDSLKKTGDLAGADASEEDKVLAMMSQAGEDFNPANYARFKPRQGNYGASNLVKQPPPTNYVCHRCGQKGHWIKFCPTNGDPNFDNPRIKAPSGIPRSQVVPVTTDTVGAMKDRQGNLVKRKVDIIANATSKAKLLEELDTSVPQELTCNICKELIKDAVIIPCCGESFCDECIREYLLENEFKCFACEEADVSPDTLVPNKRLRNDAKKFQTVMTQKKRLAVTRGLPGFVLTETATPSTTSSNKVTIEEVLTSPTNLTATDSLSTDVKSPVTQMSSASLPLSPTPSKTEPAPPSPKQSEDKHNSGSVDQSVGGDRDDTPTPPLPPISTSKSPVPSSNVQITQPISLYSNSRPLVSNAKFSGLMNTPLIPNPLGVPAVAAPLVQSTIFPQSITSNPLLQGAVPLALTVPTPVVPAVPRQPSTNPLLLQSAAAGLNSSGGSLDPAQMARLAELLVAAESHKKSPSPIPLSFEEFRRQQKVLRGLDQPPARRKSRTVSRSDSYSSRSYSSRSRSPTPIRRRRTRSRSFSPDTYGGRRSRSPSSGKSKKRRHNSVEDKQSRRRHKHKSSERISSKKSHKRKHHRTADSPPPHEEEEELQETKSKRYKRKKHKHSKKHPIDASLDKTETNSSNDADGLLATNHMNDDEIASNGSDNDKDSSSDPANVSQNPSAISPDPAVVDMNHVSQSTINSQTMEGIEEMAVQNNKTNDNSDTDIVSGGSTPAVPDTASGGSTPILSNQVTLDSVLLSSEPSIKHSKKSKHKHSKRDNGVAAGDKERRRHHHKMKKHRKHKESSKTGSSHEKRKKSHKRIEK